MKVGLQSRHHTVGDAVSSKVIPDSDVVRFQLPNPQPIRTNGASRHHSVTGTNMCSIPRTPHVRTGHGTGESWKKAALHIPKLSATVQLTDQAMSSQGYCVGPFDRRRHGIQARSERGNFKSRAQLTPWTKWAQITLWLHHPTNSAFGLASFRNMARCRSTLGNAR